MKLFNNVCMFVLLSVSVFASPFASAGFTGSDFVQKCRDVNLAKSAESSQEAVNRALDMGSCGGFVGGVVQGVNLVGDMLQAQGASNRNFICSPRELHPMDIIRLVSEYIQKNPRFEKLSAQSAVYAAMIGRYPCK